MRKRFIAGVTIGLVAALGVAVPANANPSWGHFGVAEVSVLHGVPNTPVDVYVDGFRAINDFQPGRLVGPFALPAGTYTVAITAATARNASHPIIGPIKLTFAPNGNYTVVAHLTAAGAPTASLFANDTSSAPRGDGRLVVRHTAAAPAVDILAGGTPAIRGLTNPNQASLNLPAGTVTAAVALAGTTAPVIGPANITVSKGVETIVYAWGSAANGTLALAVQSLPLGHLASWPRWSFAH